MNLGMLFCVDSRCVQLIREGSCVAFLLMALSAEAHEFWLAPSSHTLKKGQTVEVYAMIGHGEEAESLVRRSDHLKSFLVYNGQSSEPLTGRNRRLPTGKYRIMRDGMHVVAYESFPQLNELPADRFNDYLRKEGLDAVLAAEQIKPKTTGTTRELYSRFAKCLVRAGDGEGADKALGFPLEVLAVTDPTRMSEGATMVIQILRDREPMPGLLVKGFALASEEEASAVRTDEDGYARLILHHSGRWMINVVYIEPAEESANAEWQSYWASLTFEVPKMKLTE